jgi:hypothetical protein
MTFFVRNKKGALVKAPLFIKEVRRRSTLPQGHPCSTIDAERLNFRVRNGTGCFPLAMVAETLLSFRSKQKGVKTFLLIVDLETVSREPHSGRVATL